MAIVRSIEKIDLMRNERHSEASATYTLVDTPEGKMLQIDTYGSVDRKLTGKKSQTIRFSPEAIIELRKLLSRI